jgi:hypothetical protein
MTDTTPRTFRIKDVPNPLREARAAIAVSRSLADEHQRQAAEASARERERQQADERPLSSRADDDDADLTAWHEAGHAVHRVCAGLSFRYVTIRPRTAGAVGMIKARPARRDRWDLVVNAAAGPAVEARRLAERDWYDEDEARWLVNLSDRRPMTARMSNGAASTGTKSSTSCSPCSITCGPRLRWLQRRWLPGRR